MNLEGKMYMPVSWEEGYAVQIIKMVLNTLGGDSTNIGYAILKIVVGEYQCFLYERELCDSAKRDIFNSTI